MSPTSYQTALPRSEAIATYIRCPQACQTGSPARDLRPGCVPKSLKKLTFFVTEVPIWGT